MFKTLKLFIASFILISISGFLVSAQEVGYFELSERKCNEPIPIGQALEDTLDLMDEVFQLYQKNNLKITIDHIQGMVAVVSKNKGVCDFSKCVPYVENKGPELALELEAFFASWKFGARLPPWCSVKECIGNPCPNISQYLENSKQVVGLKDLKNSFRSSADLIHQIFSDKTVIVTEDYSILQDYSDIGTKITRAESIRREIGKAESELTPWSGMGAKTCMPNQEEREYIARGEQKPREPVVCTIALKEGWYWPKPWSSQCKQECEFGFTDACRECLAKDTNCTPEKRALSWLADINCQFYNVCPGDPNNQDEQSCLNAIISQRLDESCYNCLCQKFFQDEKIKYPAAECLDWLCAGDSENWFCCQ